jgi:hypothetical protein
VLLQTQPEGIRMKGKVQDMQVVVVHSAQPGKVLLQNEHVPLTLRR